VKALTYDGVNQVAVRDVPDPKIRNAQDAIVRVRRSATCGSDLHLLAGFIPFARRGDILGHEFLGEIVEVGTGVRQRRVGERVVVCSFVSCGRCWYCRQGLYSCCDNGNPNPAITESAWGYGSAGCYGYSRAMGGYAGSHAQFVRVPYADYGTFPVPDGVSDERALFASDSAPTGWMAADLAPVRPGDVVAVWGAGAVGQLAARAAILLGAQRVVIIDRNDFRLVQAQKHVGAEPLNFRHTDIGGELRDRTGGRGPDVCIEAVGMEAYGTSGPEILFDQVKEQLHIETDRPSAVREAIYHCRKGGTVFVLGVFMGLVDRFPLGAVMNKGLTVRGAQQHGQRYIPMLLELMARGDLATEYLGTHEMGLADGARGYTLFKQQADDCVRTVFLPNA
jgi:threonine dehydrogenase-like Zn-dependent dehydrogenase